LYGEWRPLVSLDLRADYEYFHNDPGPVCREKNKVNRGQAAATRKERSITNNNKPKKKRQKGLPADKVVAKVVKKKSAMVAKATPAPKWMQRHKVKNNC
jgi:hypothetical protein